MELRHNREIKARLADWGSARRLVQQWATERIGLQIQTDTYFHARQGRLKLREIVGAPAHLIWYERPDSTESKSSRYYLSDVSDPGTIKAALAAAYGVRCVVKKRREIFLYQFVRIHLDHVQQLGEFVELEAVLQGDQSWDDADRLLAELMERLGISPDQLLRQSYGEMVPHT